jgi:hypothetical protein
MLMSGEVLLSFMSGSRGRKADSACHHVLSLFARRSSVCERLLLPAAVWVKLALSVLLSFPSRRPPRRLGTRLSPCALGDMKLHRRAGFKPAPRNVRCPANIIHAPALGTHCCRRLGANANRHK